MVGLILSYSNSGFSTLLMSCWIKPDFTFTTRRPQFTFNLDVVTKLIMAKNDLIIYTLVPCTTHEMHQLDVAVYGPLKCTRQKVCHNYVQSHPGRITTKYQFNEIFSKAWLKSLVPAIVISGLKHVVYIHLIQRLFQTVIFVNR